MRPEDFKLMFKVGDLIVGWPTGVPLKITAIGDKRFLYITPAYGSKESAATMCGSIKWRFWNKDKFPDSQYAYILEVKPKPLTAIEVI